MINIKYKNRYRLQIRNSVAQKLIAKGLAFGMFFTNAPMYSFANEISLEQDKYIEEISSIETKEDLQKSVQRAVKSGEVDTWITGLANMPTSRYRLTSSVVDKKYTV